MMRASEMKVVFKKLEGLFSKICISLKHSNYIMNQLNPLSVLSTTPTSGATAVMLLIPLLPGKTEAWRRYWQELQASRHDEYELWRHRFAVKCGRVWIMETAVEALALMYVEAAAPLAAVQHTLFATAVFAHHFQEQLKALEEPALHFKWTAESLFSWP